MNNNRALGAFVPACLKTWRIAVAFTVFTTSLAVMAQNPLRLASGAVPGNAKVAPMVSAGAGLTSDQNLTYTFPKPELIRGNDGLTSVLMAGLDNFGPVGAPALPYLPVRIAIPQGRTVKSVTVTAGEVTLLGTGITLRHVEKPIPASRAVKPAPTLRDESIYSSDNAYPAKPESKGRVSWKHGVGFYEMSLCPIVYRPLSGTVGYYGSISVTVTLNPTGSSATRGAANAQVTEDISIHTPFQSQDRAASVLSLLDNPAVVSGYKALNAVARPATLDQAPASAYVEPVLPCVATNTYKHVIITSESLTSAFLGLVQYRRQNGTSSTLVDISKVIAAYDSGEDRQTVIRKFIKDAYEKWGTEFVLLGGDDSIIPVRKLYVTAVDEVDELPSDLYYQCLDGDFDANGNGVYGEEDDNVDLYSEISVGRVSAETPEEVRNWITKMKKYDADCRASADYTRGVLFVGEYMGPYNNTYAKPLMEIIRQGTSYSGSTGGIMTYGFNDVQDKFDVDKQGTLYAQDGKWGAEEIAILINSNAFSIVNHMGHSDYNYNMQMSNEDVDALVNENPVFIYSQGCIAGAIDEDCIAEHFTTSTGYGAFAGVWNSRYGWYSFNSSGIASTAGPSELYHRRFWDAVFRDGVTELGAANALSHERNAPLINGDCMRWVYYETNLFGDPIQNICGPTSKLYFDREAYKSSATAVITYECADETNGVEVVLSAIRRTYDLNSNSFTSSEVIAATTPASVTLLPAGMLNNRFVYTAEIPLSGIVLDADPSALSHDDVLVAELADLSMAATAEIDDVAPAFRDVTLRNSDENLVEASWTTYSPDKSSPSAGRFTDEETSTEFYIDSTAPFEDPVCIADEIFAASHSARIEDLDIGLYYVRILAVDKAGNTNIWCSAEVSDAVAAEDPDEYGKIIVAARTTRAFFNMETDASSWEANGCWELGTPSFGPLNASRCYGTVINGRYPDGANDSLVSPAITLGSTPTLSFRQWYDIEFTPEGASNLDKADYGIVEILVTGSGDSYATPGVVDGAWHNVSQYARVDRGAYVQGQSEGWEDVRILLPAEYDGKTVRIRFRFVSDDFTDAAANPAGWYIDNVRFLDVAEGNVSLVITEISDNADNDGCAQPGETVTLQLASCNVSYDPLMIPAGRGSVSVSAAGVPAGSVKVSGTSPAPISYPTLAPGELTPANNTVSVEIANTVPYGTVVLVSQVLVDANDKTYESYASFTIADPCEISGRVEQPTGDPVVNATVSINASEGDYIVTTDENGEFSISGLSKGRLVKAVASYGNATEERSVTAPADDLVFVLPLAEIGVDPVALEYEMSDQDAPLTGSFVISNFFVLASLDGNVGPSADIEYSITGFEDEDGEPYGWFTLITPDSGEIAPNESLTVEFELNAEGVDASVPRTVTLQVGSNAWNEDAVPVTITLNITGTVELEPYGVDAFAADLDVGADVDDDGFLEGGESGLIYLTAKNPSSTITVESFEGSVTTDPPDALMVLGVGEELSDTVTWGKIYPGSYAECEAPVFVVAGDLTDGEVVTIRVSGEATLTDGSTCPQDLEFVWTNVIRNIAGGNFNVEDFSVSPVTTNPVENARVFLYGENFDSLVSDYTTSGVYRVAGLIPGAKYWVTYSTLARDKVTVPPKGFLITADENVESGVPNGAVFASDILGYSYGDTAVPHLRLGNVEITDADGDGVVSLGEEFTLNIGVKNDGAASANNLVAEISTPEFEFDQCADITAASTSLSMIGPQATGVFSGLSARAYDYESTGGFQRFIVDIHEGTAEGDPCSTNRHWYFDFKVNISPRYKITGEVTAPADFSLAGIAVTLTDETGAEIASEIFGEGDIGSAGYVFSSLEPGDYTVALTGVPGGYACSDSSGRPVSVVDSDVNLDPFVIEPWAVDIDVDDEYLDDETGGIYIEIDEGESTEVPVTLTNSGDEDETVEVKISYNRQASEILSMDQISEGFSVIRADVAAKAGSNWTKLDPALFSKDEIEVLFKKGTSVEARDAYLARHGFRATYHFRSIPASIAVPGNTGAEIAAASAAYANAASFKSSAADDIVISVQPSVVCHGVQSVDVPPHDPLYPEQWALDNVRQNGGTLGCDIGAESAWTYSQSTGSRSIHVAVTDTGILYTHPDLYDNWTGLGWNYVFDTRDCSDEGGHGTHVAGIIGAVGNNGIGVSGVNWEVGLVSSRISCPSGFGGSIWATSAGIARAFEESYLDFGCSVNNNSWGGPIPSEILFAAMNEAKNHDMLFVIAAGNTAENIDIVPTYPANYAQWLDNVIVVAAADSDDNVAKFSSYSPKLVHLAAPGYDILSTYIDTARTDASAGLGKAADGEGNYASLSGTSMATPYVSGAAALLKSIVPTAPYTVIRDALLNGVRKDDNLAEFVSTSGHLDIRNSVRLLGSIWLRFPDEDDEICVVTNITIAAGSSVEIPLLVNDPAVLTVGDYSAVISVTGDETSREIPVKLSVNPAVVAKVDSVTVTAEAKADGKLTPGEEVSFDVVVKNAGSEGFENLTAELVADNGATVIIGNAAFGNYLPGNQTTDPALGFKVVMPASGDTAEFTLKVYEDGELVAELPVTLEMFDGYVVTVTVTDNSAPVAGAVVEVFGATAAKGVTDENGVAVLAIPSKIFDEPVASDSCTLRVIADNAVRYVDDAFDPAAATKSVALQHATLTAPESIDLTITEGTTLTTELDLEASVALSGKFDIAKGAKIAVFDDRADNAVLVEALEKAGFSVDYYTNNYQIVRYDDPATLTSEIIYMVRYSWDAALVYNYDAVISLPCGANGDGRLLNDAEREAFEGYVDRGGKVIVAGNTPLARPDNLDFAELVGLDEDSCDIVDIEEPVAHAVCDLGGPFITIAEDDYFPADAGEYDSLGYSEEEDGYYLADTSDCAKIYATLENDLGGQYIVWTGLYSDWAAPGAALDILVGSLYEQLVTDKDAPAWISASASEFAITAGGGTTVGLTVNPDRDLGVGEYTAVIYLLAETDGSSCTPVTVNLTVVPPVLGVSNLSGSVTDWGERPLSGNGSDSSALFQIIYAGADGKIDPPAEDGTPTGDDVLLVASGTGLPFGYFGCGTAVPEDAGQFSAVFNLAFDGFSLDMTDIKVYARAWDGSSPAASVAYGDSGLRTVTFADGTPNSIDFGSWVVGTGCSDTNRDTNGDSIPDNWAFEFRPDLDPRAPVEALGNTTTMALDDQFATAAAPASYDADGNPARVFATEKFVVVLEKYTHRIAVYNRAKPNELVHYYGATVKNGEAVKYTDSKLSNVSNADGAFNQPFGMALDLYTTSGIRFAVADTGNNRVQLFSLDPDTGDITFLSKYGEKTPTDNIGHAAAATYLCGPQAVAFMKGGDLLVADTGNYRVIRIGTAGNAFGSVRATYDFPEQETLLTGICADKDSVEGFWVTDADVSKQRISFHHTAKFSSEPVVFLGTRESQDFVTPSDIQVWTVNGRKRICAVDRQGSRLRIIDCQSNAKGVYTNLVCVADIGAASDATLEEYQKLWRPVGVFPVNDENLVYVADYGHDRIKWYSLTLDVDGDGMDDFWEDANGLDSTRNDAMEDADGDGLLNIGEFRSGCDPQNSDTDGDGAGDLAEMYNLRDPLTVDADPLDTIGVISIAVLGEDGNPTNQVEVGKAVTVAVTFDAAPEKDGLFTFFDEDGETVVADTPEITGSTMTFTWTATEDAVGMIDVKFQLPECDPPVTNAVELFEVVEVTEPDPDPDPEYETVEWNIKSIEFINDAPPTLRLKWDSPEVAADTACDFRIGYKASLSDAQWNTNSIPVITVTAPAEGVGDIDLTQDFVTPEHSFFKLWWLNKEKTE